MKETSAKHSTPKTKKHTAPYLSFHQVQYRYCETKAKKVFHLGPVSFDLEEGEMAAIVGPSGSGKTTLLRLIAGLEKPESGQLEIDGGVLFSNHEFLLPERREVGMVFQDHALFPHMNVKKNIIFGIRHLSKHDQNRRVYEMEDLLNLHGYMERYPHELSGGQQQRVALARTLAPRPKVVLMDEPLSNIDAELRSSLAQDLKEVLKQTNTTSLWVTHDQSEALDLSDRILVMNEGKVEQFDTPWNLYNNPKTRFVADFIGHAVFIDGELRGNSILTEIGSLDCPPCLSNQKHMEVMIRPDDLEVSVHDAGLGTVAKRQFLGAIQLYTVNLPSGQHILTYQPPHINWPYGTQVMVRLNVKSVIAFPKG